MFKKMASVPGTFPGIKQLLSAAGFCGTREVEEVLSDEFSRHYAIETFLPAASGKEALFAIFRSIALVEGRCVVAVSAYTCPDIITAMIEAGCKVHVVDTCTETLAPEWYQLGQVEGLNAVLLSNLYGMADELPDFFDENVIVIDDACQSFLSVTNEGRVGTRYGSIGVISFAQGKALGGIGGGGIVFGNNCKIAEKLKNKITTISQTDFKIARSNSNASESLKDIVKGPLQSLLEQPKLQGALSSLSVSSSGQIATGTLQRSTISRNALVVALAVLKNSEESAQVYRSNARSWHESLKGCDVIEPFINRDFDFNSQITPIFYPVICKDENIRNKIVQNLESAEIFASISYPRALSEYEVFKDKINIVESNEAEKISRCLVTLPVHGYVTREKISEGAEIISSIANSQ